MKVNNSNSFTGKFLFQEVTMSPIPNDPVMLLSFINTRLRDEYPSLTELCAALSADESVISQKLDAIGYTYDQDTNQFR